MRVVVNPWRVWQGLGKESTCGPGSDETTRNGREEIGWFGVVAVGQVVDVKQWLRNARDASEQGRGS